MALQIPRLNGRALVGDRWRQKGHLSPAPASASKSSSPSPSQLLWPAPVAYQRYHFIVFAIAVIISVPSSSSPPCGHWSISVISHPCFLSTSFCTSDTRASTSSEFPCDNIQIQLWFDQTLVNVHRLSRTSSDGILVIDNRISSHLVSKSWTLSLRKW